MITKHDKINPIGAGACGCDECELERDLDDHEKMLGLANKRILGLEVELDAVRKAEIGWHRDDERLRDELKLAIDETRMHLENERDNNRVLQADVEYQIAKHRKAREELNRFVDIVAERSRQDAKWGEQNHDPFTWLAILTEEIGEMTHEALVMRFAPMPIVPQANEAYRKELVQVAAVALAMLESFDMGKWRWP